MKLGVALAGGAFKGICHLGALEVLERITERHAKSVSNI